MKDIEYAKHDYCLTAAPLPGCVCPKMYYKDWDKVNAATKLDLDVKLTPKQLTLACNDLLSGLCSHLTSRIGGLSEDIAARRLVRQGFTVCKVDNNAMLPEEKDAKLHIARPNGIPIIWTRSKRGLIREQQYPRPTCAHIKQEESDKLWNVLSAVRKQSQVQFLDFLCHQNGEHRIFEVKVGQTRPDKNQQHLIRRVEEAGFPVTIIRVHISRTEVLRRAYLQAEAKKLRARKHYSKKKV